MMRSGVLGERTITGYLRVAAFGVSRPRRRSISVLSSRTPTHRPARQPKASAAVSLRSSDDSMPGIRRYRHGKTFRYKHDDGRPVSAHERTRIHSLAIPPAYIDVWICADAAGHLQATGRDARGRKQYRYHPEWRVRRDHGKFARVLEFGHALPALRRRLRADLARPGMPCAKVLATVVSILGSSLERIGNEVYRRDNGSFGVTTLRNRHVKSTQAGLELQFRGKGGIARRIRIDDPRVARLVRRCRALPGQQLFEYLNEHGEVQRIDSGQVNSYLADSMGEGFTAKDIRTWGATKAAIWLLAPVDPAAYTTEPDRAGVERQVVCDVAAMLGNTAAVCRASYVDPSVFAAWRSGQMHAHLQSLQPMGATKWEKLALRVLEAARRRRGPPRD